jgi:hypothetical protein
MLCCLSSKAAMRSWDEPKGVRGMQGDESLTPQVWVLKTDYPLRINSTRKIKRKNNSASIVITEECLSAPIVTTLGTINF